MLHNHTNSANGCLGLPIEILKDVLIESLGRYPVPQPFDTPCPLAPILLVDLEYPCHAASKAIRENYVRVARVCRLWWHLSDAHFYSIYLLKEPTDEQRLEKLLELYQLRKPWVQCLFVAIYPLGYTQARSFLRAVFTGKALLPPRTQVEENESFGKLRHIVVDGMRSVDWEDLLGAISSIQTLESLGVENVPFFYSRHASEAEICLPPRLRTLELVFGPDILQEQTKQPFFNIFGEELRSVPLINLRVTFLPVDYFSQHDYVAETLAKFGTSLLHADIEVNRPKQGIHTEGILYQAVPLPALIHVELMFPVNDLMLSRFTHSTAISVVTINGVNRLWEWVDSQEGKIPVYQPADFDRIFSAIYTLFVEQTLSISPPTLEKIILGDFYRNEAAPPLAYPPSWLKELTNKWTQQFIKHNIGLFARSERVDPVEELLASVERITYQSLP